MGLISSSLNNIINTMNRQATYQIADAQSQRSAFFSSSSGTLPKSDLILGHNKVLDKFYKMELNKTCYIPNVQ